MSFENYNALLGIVDAHAARVSEAHEEHLSCKLGCTACCRQDLAVSRVEADFLLHWLVQAGVPVQEPEPTALDQHDLFEDLAHGDACVFLSEGGGCGVYEARPLICRTHGLPIRLEDDEVDHCPMNFRGAEVPKGDTIALEPLNQRLGLIDLLYNQAEGDEPGGRFLLSGIREAALHFLQSAP